MEIKPRIDKMHEWDTYCSKLAVVTEYQQCIEEGLDIAQYKPLFDAIAPLPQSNTFPIITDPFGSYTGLVHEPDEKPVQDADDL